MEDIARFFKVLADEVRLQMLWLLFHHRELCVCDLMGALGITQSKASRHLATLRHAGLVVDRKEGTWAYYSIPQIKNELEGALLEALRKKCAGHPGAARILRDLHAFMKRKECDGACPVGGPRRRVATRKPAGRRRAPRQGGTR